MPATATRPPIRKVASTRTAPARPPDEGKPGGVGRDNRPMGADRPVPPGGAPRVGGAPAGRTPADDQVARRALSGAVPAGRTPIGSAPAGGIQAGRTGSAPACGAAAGKAPAGKSGGFRDDSHPILFQSYFKSSGSRTYAAQLKEANNHNPYLVLTEGRRDKETGDVRKTRLLVFNEDFVEFFKMLHEMAKFIRANPVPEDARRKRD